MILEEKQKEKIFLIERDEHSKGIKFSELLYSKKRIKPNLKNFFAEAIGAGAYGTVVNRLPRKSLVRIPLSSTEICGSIGR